MADDSTDIYEALLVPPDTTILEAMRVIDRAGLTVCMVVEPDRTLLGTITDGDIRRGLMNGIPMDGKVSEIMNRQPRTVRNTQNSDMIQKLMRAHSISQMPIVDKDDRVVGLETLLHLQKRSHAPLENHVVLMAGGLGSRLRPLTLDTPKPMLKVGDKPILEAIIEKCNNQGFNRFYISVNYMAEVIEEYFADGSRWGTEIKYLRETKKLGTAGCLGLIPELPKEPVVIMNGDIVSEVNLRAMLKYHEQHGAFATMGVREYDHQIPFGVVELDGPSLIDIREKPIQRFFVNAGVYILSPEAIETVNPEEQLDMPELFQGLMSKGMTTAAFPIIEPWIDVGRKEDYERAQSDAQKHN